MTQPDFDLQARYDALDEHRRSRGLSWAAAAREISRVRPSASAPVTSTLTGLRQRAVAEGDGVLQMLLWLQRSPESFSPGFDPQDAERFQLPGVPPDRLLRWDAVALYAALDDARQARGLTWKQLAAEIGGWTPGMVAHLARGGRVAFPGVMRLVRWLDRPAAAFVRVTDR